MAAARTKAAAAAAEEKQGFDFTKKLFISIDPGYDTHKVMVNGKAYGPYPSIALVRTGGAVDILKRTDAVMITLDNGKTYITGKYARRALTSRQTDENTLILNRQYDLYTHFSTEEFKASFLAAIFCALTEYASSENPAGLTVSDLSDLTDNGWLVKIAIEVPHAVKNDAAKAAGQILVSPEPVKFTLEYGEKTVKVNSFNLTVKDLYLLPQAVSACRSLLYNPDGSTISNEKTIEFVEGLEALVIDSGYRTTAIIRLSEAMEEQAHSLSPAAFSMCDVDEAAAADIKKALGSLEIRPASITESITKGEKISVQMPTGGTELVDALPYRDAALARKMDIFTSRIIQDNSSLANIKSVYVCGGTGTLMYEPLKRCFNSNYPNVERVELINGYEYDPETAKTKNLGPVYAVAYGGYIDLLGQYIIAEKKAEKTAEEAKAASKN